jgi:hypothetical protein
MTQEFEYRDYPIDFMDDGDDLSLANLTLSSQVTTNLAFEDPQEESNQVELPAHACRQVISVVYTQ